METPAGFYRTALAQIRALKSAAPESEPLFDYYEALLQAQRETSAAFEPDLDGLDIDSQKARIILLHRSPVTGSLSSSTVVQTLHREMIAAIPPVPDLALESIQSGKPIVELQPHGLVTQQIRRVVQSIVTD